ncbi:MAG: glycosyl transferase family 2 [Snowella sp.]|jgi:glycosyltransferase involved in cell wall biosynthesis|nr:MAG: glycosyl transferase family 2 [Snowella sp.]
MTEQINRNPLVSCIMIFFNAKKEFFFEEAIESVFAQTYDNWELLLVDDGSTDSSTAIAKQYAQQYSDKVSYLEHEGHKNRGMSATRNLGIRHAKGAYIAFLDADDVWLRENLERQVTILSSQPDAGMVYGNTQYWYSWTGNPEDNQKEFCDEVAEMTRQPNTLFRPPKLLILFLKNGDAIPCTCSLMIRRKLIEEINGFEESFRGLYEDQAFYAKVYLKAPVFVASECWSKYRQHPNSCCALAQKRRQKYQGRLFFFYWLEKYLIEQGVKEPEVWQAFQEQLWSSRYPILSKLKNKSRALAIKMKALVQQIR